MNPTEKDRARIHPSMTVLDVVSRYRETEQVFKEFDERAGECIGCNALFEPLQIMAKRYGLDLTKLLDDLNRVVQGGGGDGIEVRDDREKDS